MTRAVQGEELAGYVRQRFSDAGTEWEASLFGSHPPTCGRWRSF